MKTKNNRKGFTIVELVIVIAVIAILAAVLIPTFGNIIEKANNSKTLQELKNEYTAYTVAVAEDGEYSENVVILLDDVYYSIVDGKVDIAETVVTADTYWDAATDTFVTADESSADTSDPA